MSNFAVTSSSIVLICNKCKHKFLFRFTPGCMRTGAIDTVCPECNNEIQIIHTKTLLDESAEIQFMGATRGMFISFGSSSLETMNRRAE